MTRIRNALFSLHLLEASQACQGLFVPIRSPLMNLKLTDDAFYVFEVPPCVPKRGLGGRLIWCQKLLTGEGFKSRITAFR